MTLIIKKSGQTLVQLNGAGDIEFSRPHREGVSVGSSPGALSFAKGAPTVMGAQTEGGIPVARLARRLHDHAVLPGAGLRFCGPSGSALAELSAAGDLYVRGRTQTALTHPGQAGPCTFTSAVYAAPGLTYAALAPAVKAQYSLFLSPTTGYTTRTIDISGFSSIPTSPPWEFGANSVPINGILRIPQGSGPFPLALFVHGNHNASENSTPGYVYLLELLASHGIIGASIDCNFLNGWIGGENDARAIVHLEHIRQFRMWNAQAGHPLCGKVDLEHIMIVGHSRGGEGVGHASLFNTLASVPATPGSPAVPLDGSVGLGPYGFPLSIVVAIAPTDGQYVPVSGPVQVRNNYFIIHGSADGDVTTFPGQKTFDRAHPLSETDPLQDAPGFKALLWLVGANHNQFNSIWASEDPALLTRAEQENVARVYIGALAQAMLLGRSEYLALIRDHRLAWDSGWLGTAVKMVSQYQDYRRVFVDHYEQANATAPSPPFGGSISVAGLAATELSLSGAPDPATLQQTRALKAAWNAAGGRYRIDLAPGTLVTAARQRLVLRSSQSTDPQNSEGASLQCAVTLGDGIHQHTVATGSYAELNYPERLLNGSGRRVVMQTIRIPLSSYASAGVNVADIRSIELEFDAPQSGTGLFQGSLYIDDIQLSE
jgi:hypothetical protein